MTSRTCTILGNGQPVPGELPKRLNNLRDLDLRRAWKALIVDAHSEGDLSTAELTRSLFVIEDRLIGKGIGMAGENQDQSNAQAGRRVAGHLIHSDAPPIEMPKDRHDDIWEAVRALKPGQWFSVRKDRISRTTLQQKLGKLKKELGLSRNDLVLGNHSGQSDHYVIWRPSS